MLQTIKRMAVQKGHAQPNNRSLAFAERRLNALQHGFSLVEIAVVLLIAGLALGAGVSMLGSQLENKKLNDTQARIKEANDAIMAFAAVNRRLPCPATLVSAGLESVTPGAPGVRGQCTNPNDGFVPARTLGLTGQGLNGLLLDSWTFPIRYAVSVVAYTGTGNAPVGAPPTGIDCQSPNPNCFPLTQLDGIRNAFYANGSAITPLPAQLVMVPPPAGQLHICDTSVGIAATTCGTAITLATPAFLLWSTGRNGLNATAADETANLNNNLVYVFHDRIERGNPPNLREFDDIFLWQSTNTVLSAMAKAGVLP